MLSKSQVLEQGLKTNEWEAYNSLLIESLDSIGFNVQGKGEIMRLVEKDNPMLRISDTKKVVVDHCILIKEDDVL